MRNVFSYESKLMQTLMFVGDLFFLNLLYLLCCIPVFTIGAAQAGLHTGIRVLTDPNDDESTFGAFFRGFRNGFGTVTLASLLIMVLMGGIGYFLIIVLYLEYAGAQAPVWMSVGGLVICAVFQCMTSLIHSHLECNWKQLLKNAFYMTLAHPVSSLLLGVLMWLPSVLFLVAPLLCATFGIVFLTLYYSMAALIIHYMTKKGFGRIKERIQSK